MEQIKYGRKRSGIKKELDAKISEWLATITDEDVRKAASNDTIVTGGSIASMLMGDPVNDYDVYFRTKATTLMVAKYYVDKFIADKLLLQKESDYIDYNPVVKEEVAVNCKGVEEERVIIYMQSAGIAAIEQTPYKYFELSGEEDAALFGEASRLENESKKLYRPVFLSENAITLSDKMQLVVRFYGEPDKIHDNFDFVHAKNYYDYGSSQLVLKLDALEAILSRTLVYQGSLYPIASGFRLKKFLDRGWRISAGEQLKIFWQISELDLTNFAVIKEQLTGVDQAYLHQLVSALKEVESDKINSTYVATIIDRIFNDTE